MRDAIKAFLTVLLCAAIALASPGIALAQLVLPGAGGSGGSGTPCTTTALSIQYNNAGSFGCVAGATSNGTTITFAANDLILGGVTGSTQCLQANTSGVVSGTGAVCGGSGSTPGGANTDVQFNSSSSFGGDAGFTYAGTGQVTITNSTANTIPLTITGGSVTGSNTTQAGLSIAATINTTGIINGAGLLINITDTAQGIGTSLLDVQKASANVFAVDDFGFIRANGGTYGTGSAMYHAAPGITGPGALVFGSSNNFAFQVSGGNISVINTGSWGWLASNAFGGSTDTVLTRAAAATIQQGAADAASPVAQTYQVQSVSAGNANTAGATFTIAGSKSNGSGGGDIVLKTTLSTAASGTQNALATAITLKGGTQETIFAAPARLAGYTVSTLPSGNTGDSAYVTDAVACTFLATLTGGGTTVCPVFYNGTAWVGA